MRIKILVLPIILALLWGCKKDAAAPVPAMYFPPVSSTEWETMEPEQAGLNKAKLPELYAFLNQTNTNAFILLKNGRIVLEHYNGNNLSGGNFTASSNWYWASAGKTLTAFLIGKAQEEMYLSINDRTSKYLGSGWSSLTPAQENNITIRHQLSMSTGLDDGIPDNHCTTKNCFTFKAEPGTRWAYHNGPYTILDGVLEKATNQSFDNYFNTRLRNKIGMDGFWTYLGADHVYFSTARAMAKYGLLILNKGKWADEVILQDKTYFEQMTNSSQSINPAYGYLWWLNGKTPLCCQVYSSRSMATCRRLHLQIL